MRLKSDEAILVIVDVQGKLAESMHAKKALIENLVRIIRGVQVLEIPILWLEQNPEGLGATVAEISDLLPSMDPIAKMSFSAYGEQRFVQALKASGRTQVMIAGIETHVCVYQTAMDLLAAGYEAWVIADAVSSRTVENKQVGLEAIRAAAAGITSVEMALFDLLQAAQGERFKRILRIIK